jgi:hypothetical protein
MKSASCNGPMGTFVPFFMILSMSSFAPTPVSRQMTASLMYGIRIRFAKKPGESVEREGILPMRWQKAMAVSIVSCEVCSPVIISTPFWMGTGFMKCVLITRELAERSVGSFVVLAAILVMDMEDVFVASMAWGGQICASWEKILCLRSSISGTASITKSTSERSSREVLDVRRSRAAVASSLVMRPFPTSFSSSLSANFRPLSMEAWELSIRRTGTEAFWAATRAIPRPYMC